MIAELQAERKRAERFYGPWNLTREAILAAKGARECSDVAAEQNFPLVCGTAQIDYTLHFTPSLHFQPEPQAPEDEDEAFARWEREHNLTLDAEPYTEDE
jgi:hypothetical protein